MFPRRVGIDLGPTESTIKQSDGVQESKNLIGVASAGARGGTTIEIFQSRIEIGDEKTTVDPQRMENKDNSLDRDPCMDGGFRLLHVQHPHTLPQIRISLSRVCNLPHNIISISKLSDRNHL